MRVTGSACGDTSRTRPVAVTAGSSVETHGNQRIGRRRSQHLTRHIEHRIAAVLAGDPDDDLAGLHHLPRLRRRRDDNAAGIDMQLGIAHAVLGGLLLRLGGIELGARGFQRLLRLLELRTRCHVSRQQRPLAVEVALGLNELRLRGGDRGLRRAQGIQFVLRFELGDDLPRLDVIRPH